MSGVSIQRLDRLLVKVGPGRHRVIEPADVYDLEASGEATLVRLRGRRRVRALDTLGELVALLPPSFFRCHRSFAVNLERVRTVRRRGRIDWALRLEPPVHVVVPVGRTYARELFARFGRDPG